MKTKLWFLLLLASTSISNLWADPMEEAAKRYTSSNTVAITTNLIFSLSSREYGGFPATQFNSDELLMRGIDPSPLYTSGTNYIYVRFLHFPFEQTFDFHLFDEKGMEITKTKLGIANSKPAHLPTNMNELNKLKSVVVRQNGGILNFLFRPDDMFAITNKGIYTMKISMRICVQTTNGFPDYEVMQNLKKYPHEPYGVVISKPLCVKIIKE